MAGHAERVPTKTPPADATANALFSQGHKVRRALFNKAVVAVDDGLLAQATVDAIRRGTGPLDMANDCLELASLFKQDPAMATRVNVSAADIQGANDIAARIIDLVKPKRANATIDPADAARRDAAAARDRIWTLVERTWERNIWRAGACIFGRAVDDHVPLLGSGTRARKPAEPTPPAPAPSPTPAPAPAPAPAPDAARPR
jgi:hypothetical protein|nr:hypothetical protein [Kofleriaceae bacterium]